MKIIFILILIGFNSFGQTDSIIAVNMSDNEISDLYEIEVADLDSINSEINSIIKEFNLELIGSMNDDSKAYMERIFNSAQLYTVIYNADFVLVNLINDGCIVSKEFDDNLLERLQLINHSLFDFNSIDRFLRGKNSFRLILYIDEVGFILSFQVI